MSTKEEKWRRRMELFEKRGQPPQSFWKRWLEILKKVFLPPKKN